MDAAERNARRRQAFLAFLVADTDASEGAVFVPRGGGTVFVTQHEVSSRGLEVGAWFWAARRSELEAGHATRNGAAVAWPLFDGPKLVAYIYLNSARLECPTPENKRDAQRLLEWLPDARTLQAPALYSAATAADQSVAQFEADRVTLVLDAQQGNVSAAARALGVTRQTIYNRHPGGAEGVREQRERWRARKQK